MSYLPYHKVPGNRVRFHKPDIYIHSFITKDQRGRLFKYVFCSHLLENDHRLHKAPEPIPNSEAKLLLAHLVLPWGTRWESWVLFSLFCGFKKPFFFFFGPKKATSSVRTKIFFCAFHFFAFVVQKDTLTMSSRVHVLVHAGPDSSRTQLVRVPKTKTLYAVCCMVN